MAVEAAQGISGVAGVGAPNVGVVGDHEAIIPAVLDSVLNFGANVNLGHGGQCLLIEVLGVLLLLDQLVHP